MVDNAGLKSLFRTFRSQPQALTHVLIDSSSSNTPFLCVSFLVVVVVVVVVVLTAIVRGWGIALASGIIGSSLSF
jgi:hypothetical protein